MGKAGVGLRHDREGEDLTLQTATAQDAGFGGEDEIMGEEMEEWELQALKEQQGMLLLENRILWQQDKDSYQVADQETLREQEELLQEEKERLAEQVRVNQMLQLLQAQGHTTPLLLTPPSTAASRNHASSWQSMEDPVSSPGSCCNRDIEGVNFHLLSVDNQPMSALTRGSGCTGADEEARSLPDSPSLSSSGCWSALASANKSSLWPSKPDRLATASSDKRPTSARTTSSCMSTGRPCSPLQLLVLAAEDDDSVDLERDWVGLLQRTSGRPLSGVSNISGISGMSTDSVSCAVDQCQ